ncbi:hypothetical protein CRYUN_Cryun32bG0093600 [Craigia yunnanensis]
MTRRARELLLLSVSCLLLLTGFFSPYFGSRLYCYLGIWYNDGREYRSKISNPVWVANRNNPILDISSVVLSLDRDGSLKILCDGSELIALYSAQPAITKASATINDYGNFMLNELNPDGSVKQVLWQSFDHPTDTLLPGMKLGINFKTGFSWYLTSLRSYISAAPGSFTFGMDPNRTDQLVIWWRGDIYWTSGPWQDPNSEFPNIKFLNNIGYHFNYVSNENETYSITL